MSDITATRSPVVPVVPTVGGRNPRTLIAQAPKPQILDVSSTEIKGVDALTKERFTEALPALDLLLSSGTIKEAGKQEKYNMLVKFIDDNLQFAPVNVYKASSLITRLYSMHESKLLSTEQLLAIAGIIQAISYKKAGSSTDNSAKALLGAVTKWMMRAVGKIDLSGPSSRGHRFQTLFLMEGWPVKENFLYSYETEKSSLRLWVERTGNTALSSGAGAGIGAAIGAGIGLLGGPFAAVTVPAGAAWGASIGTVVGATWGAFNQEAKPFSEYALPVVQVISAARPNLAGELEKLAGINSTSTIDYSYTPEEKVIPTAQPTSSPPPTSSPLPTDRPPNPEEIEEYDPLSKP